MSGNITREEFRKMTWGEPLIFPDTSVLAGMDFTNETKMRFFEDIFKAIQNGELVRVVHCQECEYHEDEEPGMVYCSDIVGGWVGNDFYCGNGKRKAKMER